LLDQHAMVLRSVSATDDGTLRATRELGLHLAGAENHTFATERPSPAAEGQLAVKTSPPVPVSSASEPVQLATMQPTQGGDAEGIARAGARGLVLRRRVRAGQAVRHSGSVVVIGDVNAGAEIVAGGDVVVWGRLRGTVHAGCLGNTSAVVCALDLSPLQLRIAELITRPEEGGSGRDDSYPEVAYIRDQTIFVERWTGMRWRD